MSNVALQRGGAPGPKGPGVARRSRLSRLAEWWGPRPILQIAVLIALAATFALLGLNLSANMARVGLHLGFDFLGSSANFEIGESLIPYAAGDAYARAILAGLLNTVKVAVVGCALATLLGVGLGVARLSSNPLLSSLVQGYVEILRNTPLLLQLFVWAAALRALPGPRQAFTPAPGLWLSNRGVFMPALDVSGATAWAGAGALALLLAAILFGSRARLRHRGAASAAAAAIAGLGAAALIWRGGLAWETPRQEGFNIEGGLALSPEYAALLLGLTVNASASVAETVRGAILAISSGQWEAASALGLTRGQTLRLVIVPQAMRIVTPVLTSTYLSLTKNSSLAVAIGYPELVNILNTAANTTGQALEAIVIMMGVYLTLSLLTSVAMNAYERRWARRERA
jgi:general L-amino acid transport system permease protein